MEEDLHLNKIKPKMGGEIANCSHKCPVYGNLNEEQLPDYCIVAQLDLWRGGSYCVPYYIAEIKRLNALLQLSKEKR